MKGTKEFQRLNRTSLLLHPIQARLLIKGAMSTPPSSDGDGEEISKVRVGYAKRVDPIGSLPVAPKPLLKMIAKLGDAGRMATLVDKLGERLAFERAGVRLYQALLSKYDAFDSWRGGPSRRDLETIRDEEYTHFTMLADTILEMGGDPTAVTPSANLQAVISKGLPAALTDPRTTLQQCLEAILVAELVDNDCWTTLETLARELDQNDLAERAADALADEQEHLAKVRGWLAAAVGQDVAGATEASMRGASPAGRVDDGPRRPARRDDGRRAARSRKVPKASRRR